MIRAAIVDTNVVVAGLITGRADSPVARILDGMLAAAFPFVVSTALLSEYRAVISRAELRKLHGLGSTDTETLLIELARHAVVLEAPPTPMQAPDAGDQHLWNLFHSRDDLVLVTGDKRLLNQESTGGRVLTPLAFVQQLLQG